MNLDRPFPKLTFLNKGHPAKAADLWNLEKRIGRPLPPFLKVWLEKHSGSMLHRSNYWIQWQTIEGLPSSIAVEYVLDVDGIHEALDLLEEAFPPDHIPFGEDGDGSYLLVAEDGSVSFWDWGGRIDPSAKGAIDESTIRVADTIPEFLALLGPGPLSQED